MKLLLQQLGQYMRCEWFGIHAGEWTWTERPDAEHPGGHYTVTCRGCQRRMEMRDGEWKAINS